MINYLLRRKILELIDHIYLNVGTVVLISLKIDLLDR